jgi:broad specificity phosphatase PhoE
MTDKTLYLVRHGLIRSNVQHVYSGRSAEKLTEIGREQADQLGEAMKGWGITVVYASPLTRTVQTAEAINRHIGARIILETGLLEMDLGPWTGFSKDEVAEKFPSAYRLWMESPAELSLDGMETLKEIQDRAIRVVNTFLTEGDHHVGAIVTHAVVIKVAVLYFNHLPLNAYHTVPVPNLSVHRLICRDGMGSCGVIRML